MSTARLPFWYFFQELEAALSYKRWMDKYKLFLKAISNGVVPYDEEWKSFRQFCKILYLQDHRDEALFDQILDKAIVREKELLAGLLKKAASMSSPSSEKRQDTPVKKEDKLPENQRPDSTPTPLSPDAEKQEGIKMPRERSLFYNPPSPDGDIMHKEDADLRGQKRINFLQTDEYFPVTRRQMVKGWQFLRHTEVKGYSDRIDLPATIKQIAREGIFFKPVFEPGIRNREDTLVIFADFRGSMTPFHELTQRLIHSALNEGGHPSAAVYYFQNVPVGYVYRHPNLTGPVKVKEALQKTNRNFTLAIIISDAGSARGGDADHNQVRADITAFFLEHLNEACAQVIWLNPMPAHRWKGTAAERIQEKVLVMAPVLEAPSYSFQDTLRMIRKQNYRTSNRDL